jgi:hypothetical protein
LCPLGWPLKISRLQEITNASEDVEKLKPFGLLVAMEMENNVAIMESSTEVP